LRYALLLLLVGCIDNIDQQWELDHDHVVVARATPPRIHAGDMTNLDALVAHDGGPPTIESPLDAAVMRAPFAVDLRQTATGWALVAPDAATVAAARPAMGLADDAPVPVDVMMSFPDGTNRALAPMQVKKTVWIGEPTTNPGMPAVTVAGAPAGEELVIAADEDVYVSTTVPDGWRVNWLTSAGTLYQDDEPTGFLHIAPKDPQSGELACVIRDDQGGVVWKIWPIRTQ
jgi:hypothetical protein